MNTDMIGGIVRALGPAIVAYLAGKGVIPAGDYDAVWTGLIALVAAVWSVKTNATGKVVGAPK